MIRRYWYGNVEIRSRHGLPHWQATNGLYFLTWRLADSIAREDELRLLNLRDELARLRRMCAPGRSVELAERELFRNTERCLDRGHGAAYMRDARIADVVAHALEHEDGRTCDLISYAVMPNHLHVVLRLLDDLDRFVQRCKSYSANQCNRMLARSGAFWADDYFDVLIRNSRQLERVVTYVRNNPVKAELVGWRWTGMWPERYAQLI